MKIDADEMRTEACRSDQVVKIFVKNKFMLKGRQMLEEVLLSVIASESGLNNTTSANKIQSVSHSSVNTANRLLFRLLARPRCFSTPAEHHSTTIAG